MLYLCHKILFRDLVVHISMNQSDPQPREVVMSYIGALVRQRYEEALGILHERVRIKGPAGETFGKPLDFVFDSRAFDSPSRHNQRGAVQ